MGGTFSLSQLDPTNQQSQMQQPAQPDPTQQLEQQGQQSQGRLGQALQNQQTPAQPDPLDQIKQSLAQQYQQNTPKPAQGGRIKQLLQSFVGGAGNAMLHEVGLPTPEAEQTQRLTELNTISQTQSMEALRQLQQQHYNALTSGMLQGQAPLTPDMAQGFGHPEWAGLSMQQALGIAAKVLPAQVAGGAKVQAAQIAQGSMQVPVDKDTAMLAGMPQLEGQSLGTAGWRTLNAALSAKGIKIQDMGTDGPQGGLNMIDKAGNVIKHVSDTSPTFHRGIGFAYGRSLYTPFETVEPGTNIPTTISNLQAIQSGAPKVGIGQAQTLGGTYAIYNDLLSKDPTSPGIFSQMRDIGSRLNWSDPDVQGRIAAGIEAIREPAAQGLIGSILSTLVRSKINTSLSPEEREFVLLRGQAQAAGTGLRNVLGQRGVNEYQQQLDSGLMPRNIGSKEALNQQLDAMEALLGRVSIGLPQAGLNAPNTPTSLRQPTTASGSPSFKQWQNKRKP